MGLGSSFDLIPADKSGGLVANKFVLILNISEPTDSGLDKTAGFGNLYTFVVTYKKLLLNAS